MNVYEQMRSAYLVELAKDYPGMTGESMEQICAVLDRVSQRYEIREKETALAVDTDPIPALVKTYIVVKKTEGLSNGTLQNYALILRTFFNWCRKGPADVTANDIRVLFVRVQHAAEYIRPYTGQVQANDLLVFRLGT